MAGLAWTSGFDFEFVSEVLFSSILPGPVLSGCFYVSKNPLSWTTLLIELSLAPKDSSVVLSPLTAHV